MMTLTLIIALPMTFHDNLDEIAWMVRIVQRLNAEDCAIRLHQQEQDQTGDDRRRTIKNHESNKCIFIRDLMKRPHMPVGRFLRVGASP
jgi:hypothetical protein